jgi:hypothetical protein
MRNYLNKKTLGQFEINGVSHFGEIDINGEDTLLTIWTDQFNSPNDFTENQINGSLNDLQNVILIDNVDFGSGNVSKQLQNGSYKYQYFKTYFPHYILFGNTHLNIEDNSFTAIEFIPSHSTTLFFPSNHFHHLIHADKDLVETLIRNDQEKSKQLFGYETDNEYFFGERPIVSIFSGTYELLKFNTEIGIIEIKNNIIQTLPSSNGYSLKNEVSCKITFKTPKNFHDSNISVRPVLLFLSILAGVDLKIIDLKLHTKTEDPRFSTFNVYQSMVSNNVKNQHSIHPTQRLLSPEQDTEEFIIIINNWLNKQDEWQDSRAQFFDSFTKNNYSSDRLIKVSNMFDLIPDSVYGDKQELSDELKKAKEDCKAIFKQLPHSLEKQSVLDALGRLGTKNLKHKIKIRANILSHSIPSEQIPDIDIVINHCVDCRNHFVHGSRGKFDYINNFDMVIFFINTLEFIYGVSELIECGWKFDSWLIKHPMNHPFFMYIQSYKKHLIDLKDLIKK